MGQQQQLQTPLAAVMCWDCIICISECILTKTLKVHFNLPAAKSDFKILQYYCNSDLEQTAYTLATWPVSATVCTRIDYNRRPYPCDGIIIPAVVASTPFSE